MKVIIFGCGSSFKKALYETDIISFLDVVAVVDNDSDKWGMEIEGYMIQSPSDIAVIEYDRIMIMSVYWTDIKKQLIEDFQVSEKDIISLDNIIVPDQRNIGSIIINGDLNKGYTIDYLLENNMIQVSNDLEKFFFFGNHRLVHKWWHYFEVYEQYFSKFRKRKIKMLEIGVSQGGSLQMWKNYFAAGSEITGIDINEKCKEYEEDNIHVCIGSQNDEEFLKRVAEQYGPFDIILDDGSHVVEHQITSFEVLYPYVNDGGVYMCEDTATSYRTNFNGMLLAKNTFIEYSKNFIDDLHKWYIDIEQHMFLSKYANQIKGYHCYDGIVVLEKKLSRSAAFASESWTEGNQNNINVSLRAEGYF